MSAFDIAYLKRDLHNAEKRIADLERRIAEMEARTRFLPQQRPLPAVAGWPEGEPPLRWDGTVPPIV